MRRAMPQNILITGASSGLGATGAPRRRVELDAMAKEAKGIVPVAVDVADTEALVEAIGEAERASGGALDLVIANAGVGKPTPARKIDWRNVKQVMDVNVTA